MKFKKLMLSTGALAALVPLSLAVSCSTTWTSWHPKEVKPQKIDYSKYRPWNAARNFPEAYIIRPIVKSNAKIAPAYVVNPQDKSQVTINLDNLNNVNELIYVLKTVLNISLPNVSVDQFWDYMSDKDTSNDQDLVKYVTNTPDQLTLTFKSGSASSTVTWDFKAIKQEIVQGYQTFLAELHKLMSPTDTLATVMKRYVDALANQAYKGKWFTTGSGGYHQAVSPPGVSATTSFIHRNKLYDVQVNGLNSSGTPVDFADVAFKGASMMNIDAVSKLLATNGAFALQLSKLVNLPQSLFTGFSHLLTYYGTFLDSVFQTSAMSNWNTIKTLKDNSNKLLLKNGQPLAIEAKDYNLKPTSTTSKGQPNSNLVGKDNQFIFIGKFMQVILQKNT